MASKIPPIIMEDAEIGFRNFSGLQDKYNPPGKRVFALFLDPLKADELAAQGWNVKQLKLRDEDEDPRFYLQIEAKFGKYPPVVELITQRGKTALTEQAIMLLDFADIKTVDLVVRPYEWSVNEKTGVKAYLKSIYVTINEDALELKYAEVPELPSSARMAIEAANYDDESVVAVY